MGFSKIGTARFHEPSRFLFCGIAAAARVLAGATTRDAILRAIFELDRALYPATGEIAYVILRAYNVAVNLNSGDTFDAQFFLPRHLAPHVRYIKRLNRTMSGRELAITEDVRAKLTQAADAIDDYFLRVQVVTD